jgi:hypothetical protein
LPNTIEMKQIHSSFAAFELQTEGLDHRRRGQSEGRAKRRPRFGSPREVARRKRIPGAAADTKLFSGLAVPGDYRRFRIPGASLCFAPVYDGRGRWPKPTVKRNGRDAFTDNRFAGHVTCGQC